MIKHQSNPYMVDVLRRMTLCSYLNTFSETNAFPTPAILSALNIVFTVRRIHAYCQGIIFLLPEIMSRIVYEKRNIFPSDYYLRMFWWFLKSFFIFHTDVFSFLSNDFTGGLTGFSHRHSMRKRKESGVELTRAQKWQVSCIPHLKGISWNEYNLNLIFNLYTSTYILHCFVLFK